MDHVHRNLGPIALQPVERLSPTVPRNVQKFIVVKMERLQKFLERNALLLEGPRSNILHTSVNSISVKRHPANVSILQEGNAKKMVELSGLNPIALNKTGFYT